MKTVAFFLFFSFFVIIIAKNQTTVTNGSWSNPATWGGIPPTGSGNITINHNVTIDINYSHNSGSITIGPNGILTASVSNIAFAVNYPNGNATLTNNGIFIHHNIYLGSGTITNNGTIIADSLLNFANLTNSISGIMNIEQFKNDIGSTFSNDSVIETINFLNLSDVNNTSSILANNLCNSKNFTNNGFIQTFDFANKDTLTSPAIFYNNGNINVNNNFYNGNQIYGNGSFCINNDSWNAGEMNGTFDFCDKSGTYVDFNTGNIAQSITFCQTPCMWTINKVESLIFVYIFPNPAQNELNIITTNHPKIINLTIFSSYGQVVYKKNIFLSDKIIIDLNNWQSGIYILHIKTPNQIIIQKILKE